jgi:hypothetical protein
MTTSKTSTKPSTVSKSSEISLSKKDMQELIHAVFTEGLGIGAEAWVHGRELLGCWEGSESKFKLQSILDKGSM